MAIERLKTASLLSLERTLARILLEKTQYPWEALPQIEGFILEIGPGLPESEYFSPKENVWIHKTNCRVLCEL